MSPPPKFERVVVRLAVLEFVGGLDDATANRLRRLLAEIKHGDVELVPSVIRENMYFAFSGDFVITVSAGPDGLLAVQDIRPDTERDPL